MRLRLFVSLLLLLANASQVTAAVVGPNDRSEGDPRVYALLGRQGFEREQLAQGSTLQKICTIKSSSGSPEYALYWLTHLTQAAQVVHGTAEFIVISRRGNLLGTYDSDMSEQPRCLGHNDIVRVVDVGTENSIRHVTPFAPKRLPKWLGGGSGFFIPAERYEGALQADGIGLPKLINPR